MYHKLENVDLQEQKRWAPIFESVKMPQENYAIAHAYISNYLKVAAAAANADDNDNNLMPFALKLIRELDFKSGDVFCMPQPMSSYVPVEGQPGWNISASTVELSVKAKDVENYVIESALFAEALQFVQREIDNAESGKQPFVVAIYLLPSYTQVVGSASDKTTPHCGMVRLRYNVKIL